MGQEIIRRGCFAFCYAGRLGLITGWDAIHQSWEGIHVDPYGGMFGQPWRSKSPRIVGHVDDYLLRKPESHNIRDTVEEGHEFLNCNVGAPSSAAEAIDFPHGLKPCPWLSRREERQSIESDIWGQPADLKPIETTDDFSHGRAFGRRDSAGPRRSCI